MISLMPVIKPYKSIALLSLSYLSLSYLRLSYIKSKALLSLCYIKSKALISPKAVRCKIIGFQSYGLRLFFLYRSRSSTRLILPLGVSGISSRTSITFGSIYLGSFSFRPLIISLAVRLPV